MYAGLIRNVMCAGLIRIHELMQVFISCGEWFSLIAFLGDVCLMESALFCNYTVMVDHQPARAAVQVAALPKVCVFVYLTILSSY